MAISSPGVNPAAVIASTRSWIASSFDFRSGAKPPSSPTAVDSPRSFISAFSRWYVSAPQRSASREARRADRHQHELLQVDVVVGVGAAVEDVHHRHRQHVGVGAADVPVQRQLGLAGRCLGHGEAGTEDRVGTEPGLVVGAVELDQLLIDEPLIERVDAVQRLGDLVVDDVHRLLSHPCRRIARRRRAARRPRARPSMRRSGRRHGRWPPRRAGRRPRRWDCRASRGSRRPTMSMISLIREGNGSRHSRFAPGECDRLVRRTRRSPQRSVRRRCEGGHTARRAASGPRPRSQPSTGANASAERANVVTPVGDRRPRLPTAASRRSRRSRRSSRRARWCVHACRTP